MTNCRLYAAGLLVSGNLQRFFWLPIALRVLKVKGRRRSRNQIGTAG